MITSKLNAKPNEENDKKFAVFVDDLLSTDDESGKEEAERIYHNFSDPNIEPAEKLEGANKLFIHMNRASRNLMPGHRSPNRALKSHRFPHFMLDGDNKNQFVETPHSEKLSKSADALFGTPYLYRQRERANKKGCLEFQSSSIDADRDKAWVHFTA